MKKRIAACITLAMLCLLLLPNVLAETRKGVIWLESMEETIEETLFESPEGFPFWYANEMLAADFGTVNDVEGVIVRNPYLDDAMILSMISENEAAEYIQDLNESIIEQSAAARVQVDVYCEMENGSYNFLPLIAENGRYLRAVGAYSEEAAEGTARYFQNVLDSITL